MLNLYFSLKHRSYASMLSEDEYNGIVDKIISDLDLDYFKKFNLILIPRSSSNFIEDIVKKTGIDYKIIEKNPKKYFLDNLKVIGFSKQEFESQVNRINKMGHDFQLNKIKSNQRVKYTPYLFKKIDLDKDLKILFMDDSSFTGATEEAVRTIFNISDSFFIFR